MGGQSGKVEKDVRSATVAAHDPSEQDFGHSNGDPKLNPVNSAPDEELEVPTPVPMSEADPVPQPKQMPELLQTPSPPVEVEPTPQPELPQEPVQEPEIAASPEPAPVEIAASPEPAPVEIAASPEPARVPEPAPQRALTPESSPMPDVVSQPEVELSQEPPPSSSTQPISVPDVTVPEPASQPEAAAPTQPVALRRPPQAKPCGALPPLECVSETPPLLPGVRHFALRSETPGTPATLFALASDTVLRVYRVTEPVRFDEGSLQFELEADQAITGITFTETADHGIAVAFGRDVRVWSCASAEGVSPTRWTPNAGFIASLEPHRGQVLHLSSTPAFLVTCDGLGHCALWQKNKGYLKRGSARLHRTGIVGIAADKQFVYSAGSQDLTISIWSVPNFMPIVSCVAEVPGTMLLGAGLPGLAADGAESHNLLKLTALHRPSNMPSSKAPTGVLYVGGFLSTDGCDSSPPVAVLMEFTLGDTITLVRVKVDPDEPFAAITSGLHEGGPLITTNGKETFSVWDFTEAPGGQSSPELSCSQRASPSDVANGEPGLCTTVDPHFGLYCVPRDGRLSAWSRQSS